MNRPLAIGMVVLTALATIITALALAPVTVHASVTPDTPATPCFFYTINGTKVGAPFCNRHANDIKIDFIPLPGVNCFIQFTLNGAPIGPPVRCPPGANDIEVFFKGGIITACTWTFNEQPLPIPCPVPAIAPANDFIFFAFSGITQVIWTRNGRPIGPPIPAPPGANDVEFFFM